MMAWLRTVLGFARRELRTLIGQPRLLAVLVLGPFAILLLFGGGYRNETISLRTTFVIPESADGSQDMESAITENAEQFDDYVVPVDFTTNVLEGRRQLLDGDVDLVVVIPPDLPDRIAAGEQAEIAVLHNKLDPIQQAAVDIAARIAVQELNAELLTQVVVMGQAELDENEEQIDELLRLSGDLQTATQGSSEEEVQTAATELDRSLRRATLATTLSASLLSGAAADSETDAERAQLLQLQSDLESASGIVSTIQNDPASDDAPAKAIEVNRMLQDLSEPLQALRTIPADVIVRPFTQDTESILGRWIGPVDFFVPSALGLLIQHAGMTFAALALVRDQRLGFTELARVYRVPVSATLAGKAIAYLAVGAVLAVVLLGVIQIGLGVGISGSIGDLAAVFGLLLVASIAVGFVLSALARTDTQAVQYVMLYLLASLFFGGFFLSLDALRYPFKGLSWFLPVTYAIRGLQDVMLRGESPARLDLLGPAAIAVVAGLLALFLTRRAIRPV